MLSRRQRIIDSLSFQPASVRDLAGELGMRIADVVDDLTHVQKSVGKRLAITPARCLSCDFEMRPRFTAPSRCPRCKSERTSSPLLSIREKQ